jgi:signal transduction histidine kinase
VDDQASRLIASETMGGTPMPPQTTDIISCSTRVSALREFGLRSRQYFHQPSPRRPPMNLLSPSPLSSAPGAWRAPLLLSLVAWLALGVFFIGQAMLVGSFDFETALRMTGPSWLVWGLFAPVAVTLAFLFPIERRRWPVAGASHVAACALLLTASQWADTTFAPHRPAPDEGPRHVRPELPPGEGPQRGPQREGGRPRGMGRPPLARATIDLLFYALIVSAAQAVLWSRRAQERERRALAAEARFAEARLAALRMQINPHFLFNALNGIATLIHLDPRAADTMLGHLGELLRASLDDANAGEVPLRRELDFVRRYLAIEQTRFGDRLRIEENIAADVLDAPVPAFILQPLVENAIKHGISSVRGPGVVTLVAARVGDQLRLEVRDTGPGPGATAEVKPGAGIGLANIRARLTQLYPGRPEFVLLAGAGGGCTARLVLPLGGAAAEAGAATAATSVYPA